MREHLGFPGLIVSDTTSKAGLRSRGPRSQVLPELVASGCDVILFTRDAEEDLRFVLDALDGDRLAWARVDDAVRWQLALKASRGLHRLAGWPAFDAGSRILAQEATRRAPTLAKDVSGTLPLSLDQHRRVLVMGRGIVNPFAPGPIPFVLPDLLVARGFEVTRHVPGQPIRREDTDFVLHHGEETLLTWGHIFLDWLAMDRPWHEVPIVLVSFGFLHLLHDAPGHRPVSTPMRQPRRCGRPSRMRAWASSPGIGTARSIPTAGWRTRGSERAGAVVRGDLRPVAARSSACAALQPLPQF